MKQRRVVIADHDPQGKPRVREREIASGEVLVEHGDVRVHWESLDAAPVRRTDTHQRLIIVLDGQLEVPEATPLMAGDTLIVTTAAESVMSATADVLIATVGVDPTAVRTNSVEIQDVGTLGTGVRRVVLAGDSNAVHIRQDGEPPRSVNHGVAIVATQVWQTGGPLRSVDDGGDVTGPYLNTPPAAGVMVQSVSLNPNRHEAGDHNWHATPTVDIDVVVAGELELDLPGYTTVLHPGDLVVQHATRHAWTPRGDQAVRLMAIMIDAPELAEER